MCVYFSRPELQLGRNVGPTLIEFAKIRDVLGNNFDGDMQRNDLKRPVIREFANPAGPNGALYMRKYNYSQ